MKPMYHQGHRKKERDQGDYVGETANREGKYLIILNF